MKVFRKPVRINKEVTAKAVAYAINELGFCKENLPPIYVCDHQAGNFSWKAGATWATREKQTRIVIPLWAYENPSEGIDLEDTTGYFEYYIAHELAHFNVWADGNWDKEKRGSRRVPHGTYFYEWFQKLCPKEFQHFEYEYLNASATRYMGAKG